jgi:hypothetical protein
MILTQLGLPESPGPADRGQSRATFPAAAAILPFVGPATTGYGVHLHRGAHDALVLRDQGPHAPEGQPG